MIDQMLGHYRIIAKIGGGGMGEVYRARDERLRRDVAIKVLSAEPIGDAEAGKKLLREAQSASALNDPHICTIYEVGEANGRAFIVMELVEGRPLNLLIPPKGLPLQLVVRYGSQIATALSHAHDRGIIHRDVKASNVAITPSGQVKVLDFGLARQCMGSELEEATRSVDSATWGGALVGTLPYMAPEILRGQEADARTDVWGLGVVLCEMAGGQRPFRGKTGYELSSAILREPPAPLPTSVPASLQRIIDRCLEKEPGQRYQRASEVCAALETLQSGGTSITAVPPRKSALSPRRIGLALGSLAVVVIAILVALNVGGVRSSLLTPKPSSHIRSLAVLPLENLSHDPSQEYFAEGMTEQLTTELAQISALRVISRTSVMRHEASRKPLTEIAKDLHVDAVVEGSVMQSGERVRITAQLIQASPEKHLWAESYERELKDVLTLQGEVARDIAREIRVKLTPQEQVRLTSSRPVSSEAYDAYLKGRFHWTKGTEENYRAAKKYFERAAEIDPNYAPAYSGLADYFWATDELAPQVAMPRAKDYALKALAIDNTLSNAHTTLADVRFNADWDWPAAEKEFRRALELNPSDAEAHRMYSVFLSAMGRADEALAEIRTAQGLDPLSLLTNSTAGWTFYFARQYDRAIEQCQKVLELDPNYVGAHACLGYAYLAKRIYGKAIAECRRATTGSGSEPLRMAGLGRAYALAGRRAEARRILRGLRAESKRRYVPAYFLVTVYVALGENDEAFYWLEKAHGERDAYLTWLKVDDAVDPLRSEPRFRELLDRVGLPR